MDKLDLILEKLDKMENRQAALEVNQQAFADRQTALEANQQAFADRQTALEANQQAFADRQAAFEVNQMAFADRQASFEEIQRSIQTNVQYLIEGQKELYQLVRAIHHRQDMTDAKLEALTLDVHYIRGDLAALKDSEDRQNRILESLGLRSLEQETEIRELKRVRQ
ncbi:MAG: hypothetical protein K0R57_2106 [Paenibacillaceae bacterium]|nr:hypothetical protein [Paenibacillaceae bacterium]